MKLIYTILLLVCFNANATIYYVSNAGNNIANGTSTATSWQTISKVNATAFAAGDQVLFKSGDSWNEPLNPIAGGSTGNPLIFGAYGTGVKPVITGFQTLSGFSNAGNIWSATATNAVPVLNTVIINGAIRAKGRFPNYGYTSWVSLPSTTSIIVAHTATDYTGREMVVRSSNWSLDVTNVSAKNMGVTNDTLTLSPAITYSGGGLQSNGFFFQNDVSFLDTLNEWSYNSSTKVISVYATSSPTVQISSIDTLVNIRKKSYISFSGLAFTGANTYAILGDSANNITVTGCTFNNIGFRAIQSQCNYGVTSPYQLSNYTITNDSIMNCLNGGVYCDSSFNDTVTNNYFHNIGLYQGMGGVLGNGGYGQRFGIYHTGGLSNISYNRFDSIGYGGIGFQGKSVLMYRNFISNFGLTTQDVGGIYTFTGNTNVKRDTGTIIRSNIVINGTGSVSGVNNPSAIGIYLDNGTTGVWIDSNSVFNCTQIGITFTGQSHKVTNNTVFQNNPGVGIWIGINYNSGLDFTIKNNIIYKATSEYQHYSMQFDVGIDSLEIIDSNYYMLPSVPNNVLGYLATPMTLSQWQAFYGVYDLHSNVTPAAISSIIPSFYYNPTSADKVIITGGIKIDAKNKVYYNTATLKPFTSVILFNSNTPIQGSISNLTFQ